MSQTPFVVGQWVRGEKFYGRATLLDEILHGPRNWLWLLGTRRIGKTSVLKQLEFLTAASPELGFFPVFWDLQGATTRGELHETFADGLLDAEPRLERLGVSLADIEDEDLFRSLGRLRRRLAEKSLKPLLLCDEVEQLITLSKVDPSLLGKLRRVMQSQEGIRSVLASTIRLWALAEQQGDTSPFLHGFGLPLYIHNLSDEEARALIRQVNLPDDSRPRIVEEVAETIRARCDNHPYLLQLLCKRFIEIGDLDDAVEQVAADPMVSYFFAVDFEMLSEPEHRIIRIIAQQDSLTSASLQERLSLDSKAVGVGLHQLEHLGYVRKNDDRSFVLANYFFRRWFLERPSVGSAREGAESLTTTKRVAPAGSSLTAPLASVLLDGRYELQELIGRGATGIVYKARDRVLGATIAVKLLKPEFANHDEALERLRREILLGRDISHPNVVRMYHLGESQGTKFIVMQWVAGRTLAQLVAAEAPLAPARVAAIGSRLAGALEAAHGCQVMHRDVKPHNVLMDERDQPHLTDFGLARLIDQPGSTSSGVFLGTPDYASPEQATMLPLDARSDIYSLGVVLFEMATGRRPFLGGTTHEVLRMHREDTVPLLAALRPGISAGLSGLVQRCLEKVPSHRFQSARELRMALEAVGGGGAG